MAVRYYVTNHGSPNVIISVQQANDGLRSMIMANTSGSKGKEVEIKFRLATASDILSWKASAEAGNAISIAGYTGVIPSPDSISYENEVVKDIDIRYIPEGMDYWQGKMKLISVA